MANDIPQLRRRAWRPLHSASKLFQAVRKAGKTHPAQDVESARSLPEGSAKESLSQLQIQGKENEEQITATWSDTVRSKDVAKLNSLPEDRTGEHAELLEQHEFSLARVSSELSERSKQLQSAQTDAQQMFEQSKVQHADLLNQIQRAQLATQQAIDAQIEAEQQLQITQQASAQQLSQVTADIDQQVHAAKHSAYEESGEKLQILQQECEDQVAAARSEAQQLEAEHQERLQQLHQQLEIEQQNCLNRQQQQLETAHLESLKQLQQQLQSCQQDCESLQAEKLVLEQQVQSAKADSARELQELRDNIKSAVAAQMRQDSLKLEDEKSAHKKATGRHQIEVAELQAALERQQEDSMRREHQMLQGHMAGLAAKDIMVQQMWSELHDSKQGSRRFEVEAAELAAELSLVKQRHHLMNKITQLGEGASAYLTGQHHNWQVVPPARRPPTQSSPPKDVYAEVRPDTPRPSLPQHPPTLSDDCPLAPAQLEYAPSPEPEQAIRALSLVAQPSVHAHTSETAVQGQQADSSSPDCDLQEEHAHRTDGSSGPDLNTAHSNFTTVVADQADREEEAGHVEEEECEEQDSAQVTITADAAADQAEEAEEDGAAEEEEYEQQSEPAQDPASCDADEDASGGSSSENDSGGSSSEDEEDDQEGKAVTMSSTAGSSGTSTVPSSSSTPSSKGPAVPTTAVDAAGDQIIVGLSAAIRPSPAAADSTNVSTDGRPPAVPSFKAETIGDAVVPLTAAAQHQQSSITADSRDVPIPSSSAQNEDTFTPPAGAANISTPPVNKGAEEDEEHPVYDSLSEVEEESGEEASSSEEEDAAEEEEEAAEASEYEEDETDGSESEEEDDVASDQHEEDVAALHGKIRELKAQDSR
ncbi:TPA: hypothetical protein ACH3X3_002197 [Trebouxia sp. C0006]